MNLNYTALEWVDAKALVPWLINHTFEYSYSHEVVVFDGKEYQTAYYRSYHFSGKEAFYHDDIELTGVIRWAWYPQEK